MITSLILASQVVAFCQAQSVYAKVVMEARQLPVPIVKMLEAASENPLNQAVVMMAYRRPRLEGLVDQRKAANEFGNEVYLMCVENTDERPD